MQPEIHIHVESCGQQALVDRVTALEALVMTQADTLNQLLADFTEFAEDTNAKLDQLETAVTNGDPAANAIIADLRTRFDALRDRVGDADADGNPAPAPEPTPEPTPNPEA